MYVLLLTVCCLTRWAGAQPGAAAGHFGGELLAADGRADDYFYTKIIRNPRLSNEHPAKSVAVTKSRKTNKPKVALVKKPIPKFTDTGSDEDYLAKLKFPNRASDSIEHEDEDFSVDDYDFDVNHDEFAGRGKPLEPRVKVKVNRPRLKPAPAKTDKAGPAAGQGPVKAAGPRKEGKPSAKVTRKAVADKMKEEEYDDEFAGTKSAEKYKKSSTKDDVATDENEDSKEEEIKRPMRPARSPPFSFGTYVDKTGEKSSDLMSKMLSYLPLFSYSSVEKGNEDAIAENPWTGRAIS